MNKKPTHEELEQKVKRFEQAESERTNLMSILNTIPDGAYIVSQQCDIEYINPVIEREFGPVDGRKCYKYFHDRTETCPWCKNAEVFAGKSVQWEWHSIKNDRHYDLFDTPIKNDDGSISKLEIFHDITERKQAEEKLRKSEEELKDFFNSATDSFVFFDSKLNIIQVSKTHMEMFHPGMDKDDLIGKSLLDIVPNLKETGRFDDFMKVIETGTPFYSHDIVPHPKFGDKILSVKAFKLDSGLGTITVDVTKQRKIEMVVLKHAEWYRNFLESLNDVVFEGDNSGNMTYVNKMGESITGVLLKDIIGKSFLPSFDIKSQEVAIDEYQRTLNGESPQYELTLNNGKILHFKNEPLRNKDGDIIGVFGVARDITERKLAEEALRESEVKHKTLVKNIPGMVYRAYPDWSAEVISGSETICGYTEKELNSEKNNWLSIIHHADKEKVFKDGSELTQAQQNIVQTYRIKNKDGDIRWVEDHKTSLISKEGEFIGIDGVIFDITDRKQAEEALNKTNERLEEKVKERTTEIEEKNTALKVLLDQRGDDKIQLEKSIMSNVKELLMPNLTRLKNSTLNSKQQTAVNVLESNLNEIISPFANNAYSTYMKLTPTEIQVANFIKHGSSSKDIAESLSLSQRTVDTHRYNIRKKLKISGKGVNLRTYLLSLT